MGTPKSRTTTGWWKSQEGLSSMYGRITPATASVGGVLHNVSIPLFAPNRSRDHRASSAASSSEAEQGTQDPWPVGPQGKSTEGEGTRILQATASSLFKECPSLPEAMSYKYMTPEDRATALYPGVDKLPQSCCINCPKTSPPSCTVRKVGCFLVS